MNSAHYTLELLTRAFLGSANPEDTAELRASSIRGQLRWWFRTLGGFSATNQPLREQETSIFGAASNSTGTASLLRIQIREFENYTLQIFSAENIVNDENYFLWPFAQKKHGESLNPRACIPEETKFEIRLHWRGDPSLWPSIQALMSVFVHIGSFGSRGRRAMGALAAAEENKSPITPLNKCEPFFNRWSNITIKKLKISLPTRNRTVSTLANWLKNQRAHGRTVDYRPENLPSGFHYARRDHNEGLTALGIQVPNPDPKQPQGNSGTTYRPALGLPIMQSFSSNKKTQWKPTPTHGGRFASPVLLRPYRIAPNTWHALVIFVDAHKWDTKKQVILTGEGKNRTVRVSLDLYNKMKEDPSLTEFP